MNKFKKGDKVRLKKEYRAFSVTGGIDIKDIYVVEESSILLKLEGVKNTSLEDHFELVDAVKKFEEEEWPWNNMDFPADKIELKPETESTFKVGDKVKIRKDSVYYMRNYVSNPINKIGKIIYVKDHSLVNLNIQVEWIMGLTNYYSKKDLELVVEEAEGFKVTQVGEPTITASNMAFGAYIEPFPGDKVVLEKEKSREFESGMKRDNDNNKPYVHNLQGYTRLRFGYLTRMGADGYGDGNFLKGCPSESAVQSLDRHLAKYLDGDRTEDHLSAIIFNTQLIMLNEKKEGIKADHYFIKK